MELQRMAELDAGPAPHDFDQIEAQKVLQTEIKERMLREGRSVPVSHPRPSETEYLCASVKENVLCIMMEAAELLDGFDWKHWKADQLPEKVEDIDQEWLREKMFEAVDLQHFLNNVYIALGMDTEDVQAVYHAKYEENRRRQRERY